MIKKIKILLTSSMLLCLSACVHEGGGILPDADLKAASRYNYELGAGYARDGIYDTAITKLQKAIEQDPQNADAYGTLGYVYSKTGRDKEAADNFSKALDIEPNNPMIANNFAVYLCSKEKNKEAYKYFDMAAASPKYKNPEIALTNAGLCSRKVHDLKMSTFYLTKALSINPDFSDAQEQMAMLDYEKENYVESLNYINGLIAKKYMDDDLLWTGAKNEVALENNAEAKKYAQLLIDNFPQSKWLDQASFILGQN